MYKKLCVIGLAFLMSLSVMTLTANAQDQILGPWLWVVAPTESGQGGQNSTDIDSLAVASDNAVTEDAVAKNGAKEGDAVGDYKWILAELPGNGDINTMLVDAGVLTQAEGQNKDNTIDDITSYALITLVSATAQNDVTMRTGSDDSIKVWLNGANVFTNATNRGRSMWQDTFTVNLNQGDNLLLVKVSERGGGWGMHVGIEADVTAVYKAPPPPIVDITGEWLWMIAPTESGQGGQNSTDIDSLAVASKDTVTEEMIAKDGATEGNSVGDYDWTVSELPENGDINTMLVDAGVLTQAEGQNKDNTIDDITSYALITLVAEEAMEGVKMAVGSDDSVKVWLNGEVVHTNATNRGRSRWQDEFSVNLQEGDNLLMVKISERGGGWGMFVGIAATGSVTEGVYKPSAVGTAVEAAGKLVTTWGKLKRIE